MTLILLATIYLSSANLEDLFKAKSSQQIHVQHQLEGERTILQLRCEAEIRGQFIPEHCFKWLQRQPLTPVTKKFYLQWFTEACEKSLQKNRAQAQYHLRSLQIFSLACRQKILSSASDWLYKAKKEGGIEGIQSPNVGREIELVLRHEDVAPQILNRTAVARAPR